MPRWPAPQRPAAHAEQALLTDILDGTYPPGSALPAERDLAGRLGVTRPTLRETLQRLARDGWLTIRQGKPTLVNDYWREGGLKVLEALVCYGNRLPADFVPHLLQVRLDLAPAYTRAAVQRAASQVADVLAHAADLHDTPEAFATYDWTLHRTLTIASGNPVYTLILNGFAGFYEQMARLYFDRPEARTASRAFYAALLVAARANDATHAGEICEIVMRQSIELWTGQPGEPGSA
jgi:GntR family transcriptional regulator, negative regulator for fad regulon and positive regulator of fabA